MTKKELIEKLEQYPDDIEICINSLQKDSFNFVKDVLCQYGTRSNNQMKINFPISSKSKNFIIIY